MTQPCASCRIGAAAVVAAGVMLVSVPRLEVAQRVDLELLLAVDVSFSVDTHEYDLQIRGLAEALRHPDVINAIKAAAPNGVALSLMQWAGPTEQTVSVSWSQVWDQATAEAFAEKIGAVARLPTYGGTAIGDALGRSVSLLAENEFEGARQIIDISGDGRTNQGDSPAPVRNRAALAGITVNGLVILNEEQQLNSYYQERVIGGPGAFVVQVDDFEDFALAMRMKLIREIEVAMVASSSTGDRNVILLSIPDPRYPQQHP
jgi:Protein of unknown function (DUF1194)